MADSGFRSGPLTPTHRPPDTLQGNELFRFWEEAMKQHPAPWSNLRAVFKARNEATGRWSWAVPNAPALRLLKSLGPMLEVGAGSGYWAALLRAQGTEVFTTDAHPWPKLWTEVEQMDAVQAVEQYGHQVRTLLLVWPPYLDSMAESAVKHFPGSTVVYVGERSSGCTGTDTFHELLEREWRCEGVYSIPQWPAINDHLFVYRRKRVETG